VSIDLDHQRAELLELQGRLRAAAASVDHDLSIDDESGELPTSGSDELADHATDTHNRELDDGLEENAEQILREIETALARIDDGTYGTCTVCGEEIPRERLEAVPYATLCVADKRRLEHG
jgi:DnaK suppressor protein